MSVTKSVCAVMPIETEGMQPLVQAQPESQVQASAEYSNTADSQ